MKKWIVRLAVALAVIIVLALITVFFFLNSIVKKGVETVGPRITQTDVKLNAAKISPFSGGGELNGLFVGNPEGFKTASAIQVGDVKVKVNVSSIFSDVVVVDSVNIVAPEITFEGTLKGSNIGKLLDNVKSMSGGEKPGEKAPAEQGGKKFKVTDLVIEGGKVNVSITGMGGRSVTVPLPPVHLQNIGEKEGGVTAAELVEQVMKPLLANVTKAATEAVGGLGSNLKDLGGQAGEQAEKTVKGLKGLFKK